jgi:MFS family permease
MDDPSRNMTMTGWLLCMLACALGNATFAIAGLLISSLPMGLAGFNLYTIAQTLAGPRAAGKWMGVQNAIGNLAGMVAPVVTGVLVDWTGRYTLGFLVAGVVGVAGAASWFLLVRRVEPIVWAAIEPRIAAAAV